MLQALWIAYCNMHAYRILHNYRLHSHVHFRERTYYLCYPHFFSWLFFRPFFVQKFTIRNEKWQQPYTAYYYTIAMSAFHRININLATYPQFSCYTFIHRVCPVLCVCQSAQPAPTQFTRTQYQSTYHALVHLTDVFLFACANENVNMKFLSVKMEKFIIKF